MNYLFEAKCIEELLALMGCTQIGIQRRINISFCNDWSDSTNGKTSRLLPLLGGILHSFNVISRNHRTLFNRPES